MSNSTHYRTVSFTKADVAVLKDCHTFSCFEDGGGRRILVFNAYGIPEEIVKQQFNIIDTGEQGPTAHVRLTDNDESRHDLLAELAVLIMDATNVRCVQFQNDGVSAFTVVEHLSDEPTAPFEVLPKPTRFKTAARVVIGVGIVSGIAYGLMRLRD